MMSLKARYTSLTLFALGTCALAASAGAELLQHRDVSAAMALTIAQTAIATCKANGYDSAYQLPRSLSEAVALLRAEQDLARVLGKEFVTLYTEIKDLEHEEFMRVISPWEREHLLLHV